MKQKLLNWAIKSFWNAPDEYPNVKHLHKDTIEILATQADEIKKTAAWKFLMEDMRRAAIKEHILKGTHTEGYIFGKASVWTVKVLEDKIENLSKIK